MELRLVQAHVPERQASEEAREQDEDGDETRKDDELGIVRLRLPLHERVDVFRSGLAREASKLAQPMCGESEQRVS